MLLSICAYFGAWLMRVSKYIGILPQGKCQMCHTKSYKMHAYEIVPSLPELADWDSLIICKKCAKRELGRGWKLKMEALHE